MVRYRTWIWQVPAGSYQQTIQTLRPSPRLNLTHGEGLLELGGELVGLLDLDELAGGDHVPEDLEEGAVGPGLALVVRLDVGPDRGTGGAGAVLELADGGDDSCLVHG